MTFPTMLLHTVQVVKPGRRTSRAGDTVLSWDEGGSTPPIRTAKKAWVTMRRPNEDQDMRDDSQWVAQFFFPSDTDVANEDRLEWKGRTFSVVGPPKERYTLRGLHHLEVEAVQIHG